MEKPSYTKALVGRYVELYNTGQLALADEVFAADYADRTHPRFEPGPQGVKYMVKTLRAGFPDAHLTAERIVSEDGMVAFHWT